MFFGKSEDTKLDELELHDVEYRVDNLSRFNSKLEHFQDFVLLLNVIYPTSFEITGLYTHEIPYFSFFKNIIFYVSVCSRYGVTHPQTRRSIQDWGSSTTLSISRIVFQSQNRHICWRFLDVYSSYFIQFFKKIIIIYF